MYPLVLLRLFYSVGVPASLCLRHYIEPHLFFVFLYVRVVLVRPLISQSEHSEFSEPYLQRYDYCGAGILSPCMSDRTAVLFFSILLDHAVWIGKQLRVLSCTIYRLIEVHHSLFGSYKTLSMEMSGDNLGTVSWC